jgi:hypothetical protein
MPKKVPGKSQDHGVVLTKVLNFLERFVSQIPSTDERKSSDPAARARKIANTAAAKAALLSGSLALPAGPLAYATALPDLLAIWRLQAQMVADVAGAFGKKATLCREQMLYCLFRHAAAQAVRDFVVRVGSRLVIRRASLRVIQRALRKIGVRITQRMAGRALTRWIPLFSAVGVGAYAYYDTAQVGKTAIELFGQDFEVRDDAA